MYVCMRESLTLQKSVQNRELLLILSFRCSIFGKMLSIFQQNVAENLEPQKPVAKN